MAKEAKNLLINHLVETELKRCIPKYLRGRLLDIGCGTKPYRDLLEPYVTEHLGVDYPATLHGSDAVDVWCTAYEVPLADGMFDSVLCTSVLEHLEEPELALRECYRLLRPGGVALYVLPFIWHIHEEPRDFFRFSRYGVKYIFEKAGFRISEIRAVNGFWVTFGQLFVYNLYRLNRGPLRWFHLVDAAGLVVQSAAYVADKIDKTEAWTSNYVVVAIKPE
jgi:SAM-dependent methyltransferase